MKDSSQFMSDIEQDLIESGFPPDLLNCSFYELEEKLQRGHYKVLSVPMKIGGYVLFPAGSERRTRENYRYIKKENS